MTDHAMQPEFSVSFATKAEAVAAAFEEMRLSGDTDAVVIVHRATCAGKWDLACDCSPEVIPQMEGRA